MFTIGKRHGVGVDVLDVDEVLAYPEVALAAKEVRHEHLLSLEIGH